MCVWALNVIEAEMEAQIAGQGSVPATSPMKRETLTLNCVHLAGEAQGDWR